MGNSCKPRDTLRQATGTIRASTRRTNLWSGSPGTTRWRTASWQGLPSKVAIEGLPSKVAIEGLPSKVAIEGLPSKVAIDGLPSKVAIEGNVSRRRRSGRRPRGEDWWANAIPGGMRNPMPTERVLTGTGGNPLMWGVSPQMAMVYTTWRGTCGNGAQTGRIRATMPNHLNKIHRVPVRV